MSETSSVFANGAKLVGETFVPGASLMLDGNVPNGLAHTAAGWGAVAVLGGFGPFAALLVMADSYSKSVTHKYLLEHVVGAVQTARSSETARPTTAAGGSRRKAAAPAAG